MVVGCRFSSFNREFATSRSDISATRARGARTLRQVYRYFLGCKESIEQGVACMVSSFIVAVGVWSTKYL